MLYGTLKVAFKFALNKVRSEFMEQIFFWLLIYFALQKPEPIQSALAIWTNSFAEGMNRENRDSGWKWWYGAEELF